MQRRGVYDWRRDMLSHEGYRDTVYKDRTSAASRCGGEHVTGAAHRREQVATLVGTARGAACVAWGWPGEKESRWGGAVARWAGLDWAERAKKEKEKQNRPANKMGRCLNDRDGL